MKELGIFFVILITINCWLPSHANAAPGPKIEGPWVWTIVSTGNKGGAGAAASGIDYLAQASKGEVTERKVAANGASVGDAIGNRVWTPGKIAPTGNNNITKMLNTIGLGGNRDKHVAYGCISLYTPIQHDTRMHIGSDDAVKVWLNGDLVHAKAVNSRAKDYQTSFRVTLKQGKNILLVAVYENVREWSGFFGFEKGTPYSLVPPDTRSSSGPKIEGPWAWTIVSTGNRGGADAAASGIDYLAQASRREVTERKIATNGAGVGDTIGNRVWISSKIASKGNDNITQLLNATGLGGNRNRHVAYGCISLYTPREQDTMMYVGSDDAVKVWLNGVLVHAEAVNRSAKDYQSSFPVTLKKGENILLVAVYDNKGAWSGFFGFEDTAIYSLDPTGTAVFSISPSPVTSPAIGQRLTFNLNIADGVAVAGYQVIVQFDASALRFVNSSNGDYLPSDAFFSPRPMGLNSVEFASTTLTGVSNGDGTLATFTFEVLAVKDSTLTLHRAQLSDKQGNISHPLVQKGEVIISPALKADVTANGVVNILDLVYVASNFGKTGQNPADVNDDGIVNIADLVLVAASLGTITGAPSLDPSSLELLTTADVHEWLSQAHRLNSVSPTYQRGLLVLEQLLAVLIPKETVLLPNYPNPFNPETWIPYQLAKAGDVRISIYDARGSVVRVLTLGHQGAGYYTSKSRAAYWDGRNALGERLASSIYFYQLQTDSVSSMRKMIILK